ncbi:MAG: hypothetical protein ACI88G_001636, partial [Woeseiaceae bacterium]
MAESSHSKSAEFSYLNIRYWKKRTLRYGFRSGIIYLHLGGG